MTILTETKSELDKNTIGFGLASIIVIIFNTILTILKELYSPILTLMKSISVLGVKHHWLVHGLVVVILFFILGWYFSKKEITTINDTFISKAIIWVTILCSLGIIIFFLIEFLK